MTDIIIYGINKDTLLIADAINQGIGIVGISDSYADIDEYGSYKFIRCNEIKDYKFDYIVVGVRFRKTFETIKSSLIDELGIPEEKIVSFYAFFFEQRVDEVMLKARFEQKRYDGIVLGISHSQYGINPQILSGNWCNLAFSSEDIYTHKKVFEKCTKEYSDIILNLKRVIIDLWDYRTFQYDFSLTNKFIETVGIGAYSEDFHNFSQNVNYSNKNVEEHLKEKGKYSSIYARENRHIRKIIFDEKKFSICFQMDC